MQRVAATFREALNASRVEPGAELAIVASEPTATQVRFWSHRIRMTGSLIVNLAELEAALK